MKAAYTNMNSKKLLFKDYMTDIRSISAPCQHGIHKHKRTDGTIRTANPNRTVPNIFDLAHHNQHSCQADLIIKEFWKECKRSSLN